MVSRTPKRKYVEIPHFLSLVKQIKMLKAVVFFAVVLSCVDGKKLLASQFATKQLSGPPSEFDNHNLPNPIQG